MLLVLVVMACAGCDQATKTAAKALLTPQGTRTMLHNTITLVYTENPGAFLSLGATWPAGVRLALFTVATGLLLPVALPWLLYAQRGSPCQQIGLALIVGGGVGNLIDRLVHHGCVVDFIHLAIGPVRTGVFNVADVAIMGGTLLLVTSTCWGRPTSQPP
jgi:signal peptidase II